MEIIMIAINLCYLSRFKLKTKSFTFIYTVIYGNPNHFS